VEWTPPGPGEYFLQVSSFRSPGGVTISAPVRVCVLDFDFSTLGFPNEVSEYTGPCPPPVPAPSTDIVSMVATASPASLAYYFSGCPSAVTAPTLSFQADVVDTGNRVVFVTVQLNINDPSGGFVPDGIFLNQTSTLPSGNRMFTGSVNVERIGPLSLDFAGGSGSVDWTAQAWDAAGNVLATDGPHNIPISPCVPGVPAPLIAPLTSTPLPIIIRPAEPTKKPHGGGAAGGGCSSYSDPSGCTTNGCSWNKLTSTCH
jgi:hypothetical protein